MKKDWNGLTIKIEVDKGGTRSGKSPDGSRWSVTMPCAYGHIPATEGDDGEEVDVFVGPDDGSPHVFAINQKDAKTGDHDEQKIMLNFADETSAAKAYVASFSDGKGKDRLGRMMKLSVSDFKKQIEDLRTVKAYAAGGRVGYAQGGLVVVQSPSGAKFQVASAYAPKFEALLADLEGSGYSINPKTSGGYNYRNIKGTKTLSNHAHGAAIDVNWDRNARGTKGEIDPELARSLSERHGLRWGGDYKNPDPMHFEVVNPDPLPVSSRGITAYAGHTPAADDADISEKPYTPSPIPKGWGEGVGQFILKQAAADEGDSYPRAAPESRLAAVRPRFENMPYGASLKEWSDMPYLPPQKKADGGPAELRSYEPTLGDRFNQALDAVGGVMGYEDLPERTSQLWDLIEIPANLAGVGAPVSRTLSILGAGEKGRDASIADSLMRYGGKEITTAPGSALATKEGRRAFQNNNARMADDARGYIRSRAPETMAPVRPEAVRNSMAPESRMYGVTPANSQTVRKPKFQVLPGDKKADGGPVKSSDPRIDPYSGEELPPYRIHPDQLERATQKIGSYGMGSAAGAGALIAGDLLNDAGTAVMRAPGVIPKVGGAALKGLGWLSRWVGTPSAIGAGMYGVLNSEEPDIEDVYLRKLTRENMAKRRDDEERAIVEGRAAGGAVTGPLRSPHMGAGGRTDTLPISVPSGAFVFPADTVSALGENNTEHGFRVLQEMFAESRANRGNVTGQEKNAEGDYESSANHVPIIAAEGEWVVPPEDVAWVGGGDLDRGHKILEKLVLRIRSKHIDELKKLPRPHR